MSEQCPLYAPKADIDRACRDVRFVPKTDSCTAANFKLLRGSSTPRITRLPVLAGSCARIGAMAPAQRGNRYGLQVHGMRLATASFD